MIPQPHQDNFTTLQQAFDAGDACLLECHERATGKPAYVICAVNRRGEEYELVPFARLFDGNPYELLSPPGGRRTRGKRNQPTLERNHAMKHTDRTESAAPHTPEPWDYDMDFIVAPDPIGQHPDIYIAEIAHSDDEGRIAPYAQHQANARRIVAAVNACAGLSTEALEQGVIAELLEALENAANDIKALDEDYDQRSAYREALAVVAKAAGGSPAARRKPIVIEVRGGVVQDVLNVPPGYDYEVNDYDSIETDGGAA